MEPRNLSKKRRKREVNMPQQINSDLECPPERNRSDEGLVCAKSDAVGSFDECRLEPKHNIFLSHSRAQKNFTWQLCEDLENVQHYPFFDRRDASLPNGEKFLPLLLDAARQCRIAVLVLSKEFFTCSEWPMIELTEFVKAQESSNPEMKILPLCLGINIKELHNKDNQAHWFKEWEKFADANTLEAWKCSFLKIIHEINIPQYLGLGEGEVVFRKRVVKYVCNLLPPDVKYPVSDVQSLKRLCEPIEKKLEVVEVSSHFNVKVVGLYGMGGVGKTTISRAVCNAMFGNFSGKVCHVDLGGKELPAKLHKKVLRNLTNADEAMLEKVDDEMLKDLLKKRMSRQEVFLVLDNVWDDQVEEALTYLRVGYHAKSMVLVISRSIKLFERLFIKECSCMEMPSLEEEGALNILLHHSGISRDSIVDKSEWKIVRGCAEMCYFTGGKKLKSSLDEKWAYHPLALKALGCQLVNKRIKDWDEALEGVGLDRFNMWTDAYHQVFSILRPGFDALSEDIQRHIFLDLALLWSFKWCKGHDYDHVKKTNLLEWEWLCNLYPVSEAQMIQHVKAIERKGLLDKVYDITKLEYSIHDLYYDFAKAEAEAGGRPFKTRRWFLNEKGTDVLRELKHIPPKDCFHWPHLKRLMICKSGVKSLKGANLLHCKNVEVLVLAFCKELEEVDVTKMNNLRLVVVHECEKLGKLEGLEKLTNLEYFHQDSVGDRILVDLEFGSNELRVVRLKGDLQCLSNEVAFPMGLMRCPNLYEVVICHPCVVQEWKVVATVDVGKFLPTSLQKLDLAGRRNLVSSMICVMAAFTNLQELRLRGCNGIQDLTGLCELILLQKLDLSSTSIVELPCGLGKLRHLQYLDMSYCENLKSIVNIIHATALRTVLATACDELCEAPDDWSSLQKLEVLKLRFAKIRRLPDDYERLAAFIRSDGKLKLDVHGCWGLIGPLVQKLEGSEVSLSHEDGCNCSGESMDSWVATKKHVNVAAYNWLLDILGTLFNYPGYIMAEVRFLKWTYLLDDDNQVSAVLIRALCEHIACGSRTTNVFALIEDDLSYGEGLQWWAIVATAPCTFKAVTERAMMEPWNKTLLHYTIVEILPRFLDWRGFINSWGMVQIAGRGDNEEQVDKAHSWFLETLHYRAMVALLEKCRDKLDEAASEQGIDIEGKNLVKALLCELKAPYIEELHDESILKVCEWAYEVAVHDTIRYDELFPNFPFGPNLATKVVSFSRADIDDTELNY